MVTTLLTDLSEVLINGIDGLEWVLANKYYKDPADQAAFARRFLERRAEMDDCFCILMRGDLTETEYWEAFLQGGDWPFDIAGVKSGFSQNLRGIIPGTMDVFHRIIGYPGIIDDQVKIVIDTPPIYLVSDHIEERLDELEQYHPEVFEPYRQDIFRLIQRRFWSCELGFIKQDPEFFKIVFRRLCIAPENALFIDDNPGNIAAARRIGMPSILFQNARQLEREMHDRYGFVFASPMPHTH